MNHGLNRDFTVCDWVIKENKAENWGRLAGSWEDKDTGSKLGVKTYQHCTKDKRTIIKAKERHSTLTVQPHETEYKLFSFLMCHSNMILTKIFMFSDVSPEKAWCSFKINVSCYIPLYFSGNTEIILFQKLHTGLVLSQITTFPSVEQRSCITDFFPVWLSDVLRIGGLTLSLGVVLGGCKFYIYVFSALGLHIDQFIFLLNFKPSTYLCH